MCSGFLLQFSFLPSTVYFSHYSWCLFISFYNKIKWRYCPLFFFLLLLSCLSLFCRYIFYLHVLFIFLPEICVVPYYFVLSALNKIFIMYFKIVHYVLEKAPHILQEVRCILKTVHMYLKQCSSPLEIFIMYFIIILCMFFLFDLKNP